MADANTVNVETILLSAEERERFAVWLEKEANELRELAVAAHQNQIQDVAPGLRATATTALIIARILRNKLLGTEEGNRG